MEGGAAEDELSYSDTESSSEEEEEEEEEEEDGSSTEIEASEEEGEGEGQEGGGVGTESAPGFQVRIVFFDDLIKRSDCIFLLQDVTPPPDATPPPVGVAEGVAGREVEYEEEEEEEVDDEDELELEYSYDDEDDDMADYLHVDVPWSLRDNLRKSVSQN